MRENNTKTNRSAVVLHIKVEVRNPQRFGEMIHHLSDVIKCVSEFFRVRPIAMSEARVIRRDKVVAIGKPREERLEHPRRRGKAVQQQNRRGVFWSSLAIKNREAIHLNRAVGSVMFHVMLLSFILAQQRKWCEQDRNEQSHCQNVEAAS